GGQHVHLAADLDAYQIRRNHPGSEGERPRPRNVRELRTGHWMPPVVRAPAPGAPAGPRHHGYDTLTVRHRTTQRDRMLPVRALGHGAMMRAMTDGTGLLLVGIEPWTDNDLDLLRRINTPEMKAHLGGPESEEQVRARHQRYVEIGDSGIGRMFRIVL